MTVLPEAKRAVLRAASRSATTQRRSTTKWIAVFATATVAIGGTAFAATMPWRPDIGDERRGRVTASATPVPSDQSAALSVLRRSQTPDDRGARVRDALSQLSGRELGGARTADVRLLDQGPESLTLLVPVERSGTDGRSADGEAFSRDVLCLFEVTDAGAAQRCGDVDALKAGDITVVTSSDRNIAVANASFQLAGLVPDGVATVEIATDDSRTFRGTARNNAYVVTGVGPIPAIRAARWFNDAGDRIGPR